MSWNKIETAGQGQRDQLKLERLVAMIQRVSELPVYAEKLQGLKAREIHSLKDLAKLPFTTKEDLRQHYPHGLFAVPPKEVVRFHASSGTTGKPTIVGYTKKDLALWGEVVARSLTASGADDSDCFHISYGFGLFTGGLGLQLGAETIGAATVPISVGNTPRQLTMLKDLQASVLCCTPSYGLYLAEAMNEMGMTVKDLKLKRGIFGAEPWSAAIAQRLEQQLGIEAFDIYGLSEIIGPGVAFGCQGDKQWLHLNEDHFIPEIIDPLTGEVLEEGAEGELVLTCVTKEALPMIRYRTGDITSLSQGTCACGRTLVRMQKPRGRTDDMLIIRGVNVFPSQIEEVLLRSQKVLPYYELHLSRQGFFDVLEVLVEQGDNQSIEEAQQLEKSLRRQLKSQLGIDVGVQLVWSKSLPRTEGKASRLVDKR